MQDKRVQDILSGIDKRVQSQLEANNEVVLETLKEMLKTLGESIEEDLVSYKEGQSIEREGLKKHIGLVHDRLLDAKDRHKERIDRLDTEQQKQAELLETWEQVLSQLRDDVDQGKARADSHRGLIANLFHDFKVLQNAPKGISVQDYNDLKQLVTEVKTSLDNTAATLISTNNSTHQRLEDAFGCMGVIGEQIVAESKKTTEKFASTNESIKVLQNRCDVLEQQKNTFAASVEAAKASVLDSTQSLVSAATQHVLGAVSATQESLETAEENIEHLGTGLGEVASSITALSDNIVQLAKSTSERASATELSLKQQDRRITEVSDSLDAAFSDIGDIQDRMDIMEQRTILDVFEFVDTESLIHTLPIDTVQYLYTDDVAKPMTVGGKLVYIIGLMLLLGLLAPMIAANPAAGLALLLGLGVVFHSGVQATRAKTEIQVTYKLKTERCKHKVLVRSIKYPAKFF